MHFGNSLYSKKAAEYERLCCILISNEKKKIGSKDSNLSTSSLQTQETKDLGGRSPHSTARFAWWSKSGQCLWILSARKFVFQRKQKI